MEWTTQNLDLENHIKRLEERCEELEKENRLLNNKILEMETQSIEWEMN